MASADLGETAEDELDDQDDDDQEDEDERAGHTRRWVRYVMPVMVEVDCDTDEIASVVTLPGEVRRRPTDEQLQAHALYVSEPEWQYPGLRSGRPVNWPTGNWYEDYFPRGADGDAYAEARPYADSDEDG